MPRAWRGSGEVIAAVILVAVGLAVAAMFVAGWLRLPSPEASPGQPLVELEARATYIINNTGVYLNITLFNPSKYPLHVERAVMAGGYSEEIPLNVELPPNATYTKVIPFNISTVLMYTGQVAPGDEYTVSQGEITKTYDGLVYWYDGSTGTLANDYLPWWNAAPQEDYDTSYPVMSTVFGNPGSADLFAASAPWGLAFINASWSSGVVPFYAAFGTKSSYWKLAFLGNGSARIVDSGTVTGLEASSALLGSSASLTALGAVNPDKSVTRPFTSEYNAGGSAACKILRVYTDARITWYKTSTGEVDVYSASVTVDSWGYDLIYAEVSADVAKGYVYPRLTISYSLRAYGSSTYACIDVDGKVVAWASSFSRRYYVSGTVTADGRRLGVHVYSILWSFGSARIRSLTVEEWATVILVPRSIVKIQVLDPSTGRLETYWCSSTRWGYGVVLDMRKYGSPARLALAFTDSQGNVVAVLYPELYRNTIYELELSQTASITAASGAIAPGAPGSAEIVALNDGGSLELLQPVTASLPSRGYGVWVGQERPPIAAAGNVTVLEDVVLPSPYVFQNGNHWNWTYFVGYAWYSYYGSYVNGYWDKQPASWTGTYSSATLYAKLPHPVLRPVIRIAGGYEVTTVSSPWVPSNTVYDVGLKTFSSGELAAQASLKGLFPKVGEVGYLVAAYTEIWRRYYVGNYTWWDAGRNIDEVDMYCWNPHGLTEDNVNDLEIAAWVLVVEEWAVGLSSVPASYVAWTYNGKLMEVVPVVNGTAVLDLRLARASPADITLYLLDAQGELEAIIPVTVERAHIYDFQYILAHVNVLAKATIHQLGLFASRYINVTGLNRGDLVLIQGYDSEGNLVTLGSGRATSDGYTFSLDVLSLSNYTQWLRPFAGRIVVYVNPENILELLPRKVLVVFRDPWGREHGVSAAASVVYCFTVLRSRSARNPRRLVASIPESVYGNETLVIYAVAGAVQVSWASNTLVAGIDDQLYGYVAVNGEVLAKTPFPVEASAIEVVWDTANGTLTFYPVVNGTSILALTVRPPEPEGTIHVTVEPGLELQVLIASEPRFYPLS